MDVIKINKMIKCDLSSAETFSSSVFPSQRGGLMGRGEKARKERLIKSAVDVWDR